MHSLFMPIAAAFAPNYTLKDVIIALECLSSSKQQELQNGDNIQKFEKKFQEYMSVPKAVSFDSGRSGFFAILKAMGISEEDEIIMQAFTTVALSNTIRLFGAIPVYVDIKENTYNMDPEKIEGSITQKTKAIIIQHTFGNPADLKEIMKIATKHNLYTIEDCAHSLGAEYAGEKTGKFADAAFFSFGRDKVVSSVAGGMVIAKNQALIEKIEAIRNKMDFPSAQHIRKTLLHPIITFIALHTYNLFGIGRAIMFFALRLGVIDKAYSPAEKKGETEKDFAKKMPNALCKIAIHQLEQLDYFNEHRIKVAKKYTKEIKNEKIILPETEPQAKNIFLWFTIKAENKKKTIKKAGKKDIILGDWFPQAIGPVEVNLKKAGYKKGSCPVAEKVSAHCINLPTHHNIHEQEAAKVIDFINNID